MDAGPLPLLYPTEGISDGKHSQSLPDQADADASIDSNFGKQTKKPIVIIGNPLPLNYGKETASDGDNVGKNPVDLDVNSLDLLDESNDRKKKERKLILTNLGDPLPLSYKSSTAGILSDAHKFTNKKKNKKTKLDLTNVNKRYDFGDPLPLDYVNVEIKTDTYKKQLLNNSDSKKLFKNDSTTLTSLGKTGVANEIDDTDPSFKIPSQILNESVQTDNTGKNDSSHFLGDDQDSNNVIHDGIIESPVTSSTPITETRRITNDIEILMDTDLIKYINTTDKDIVVSRVEKDADFKLSLIKYSKQLERQCQLLQTILNGVPSGNNNAYNPSIISFLKSAAAAVFVFIFLCILSYYLAD